MGPFVRPEPAIAEPALVLALELAIQAWGVMQSLHLGVIRLSAHESARLVSTETVLSELDSVNTEMLTVFHSTGREAITAILRHSKVSL